MGRHRLLPSALILSLLLLSLESSIAFSEYTPDAYPLRPALYEVSASYDPDACRMTVDCRIELEVSEEHPYDDQVGKVYTLALPAGFKLGPVETDLPPPSRSTCRVGMRAGRGLTLIDLPSALPLKDGRAGVTIHYHGRPDDYSAEEDRYWARATPEAVWIPRVRQWLPLPLERAQVDWTQTEFRVDISVPSDWTVLVPGCAPREVDEGGDQRIFRFDYRPSGGSEPAIPWTWVAGPYRPAGTGTAGGVSYSVWALPDWPEKGQALADELGPILDYEAALLGQLPDNPITAIQVPPEQGGGEAFGRGGFIVGVEGSRGMFGSTGDDRRLWAHELTHCLNPYFDEGLVDFVAAYYLLGCDLREYAATIRGQREYFLDAVKLYGDRPINEAVFYHEADSLPEYHAFLYAKPTLVWNMFREVFGDDTLRTLIHTLHQRSRLYDWWTAPPSMWDTFVRDTVAEVAGPRGAAFYDRWFEEAYPLDLALRDAWSWPAPDSGEWVLSFIVEDLHEEGQPPARETVPEVSVAVSLDGGLGGGGEGPLELDVPLTGDSVCVTTTCPARPVGLILDPEDGLLDYDPSNDALDEAGLLYLLATNTGDTPCAVWGPAAFADEADTVAGVLPGFTGALAELVGSLPEGDFDIVVDWAVPGYVPDHLSGWVAHVEPPGAEVAGEGYEECLLRNVAEALATGCVGDRGLGAYLADVALSLGDPEALGQALADRRDTFLSCGRDRPIYDALTAEAQGLRVAHADAYIEDKAALVWRMFDERFGRETLRAVAHEAKERLASAAGNDGGAARDAGESPVKVLEFLGRRVEARAGRAGRDFFHHWFFEVAPLDLAVQGVHVREVEPAPGGEDEEPSWTVSAKIVDHHGESPPARATIPWVEVGLLVEEGGGGADPAGGAKADREAAWVVSRVDLTGDTVEMELTVPGWPLKLVLDPYTAMLDYDPGNNIVELGPPVALAERLLGWLPSLGVVALITLMLLVVRHRPVVRKVSFLGATEAAPPRSRGSRDVRSAVMLGYAGAVLGLGLGLLFRLGGVDTPAAGSAAVAVALLHVALLAGFTLALRRPALLKRVLSFGGPASAVASVAAWVFIGTPASGAFLLPVLLLLSALAGLPRDPGEPYL